MKIERFYQNDVGTRIRVNTETSLVGAVSLSLKVQKPSGTEVEWDGTADTETEAEAEKRCEGDDSADPTPLLSVITYTVQEDDFDEVGLHKLQSAVENLAGNWLGNAVMFRISPPWGM